MDSDQMTTCRPSVLWGGFALAASLLCSTLVQAQGIACTADIDGDGAVGGTDLAALLAYWMTDNPTADLDDSGQVNGVDLATLLSQWGFDCEVNPFCDAVQVEFTDEMMVVTTSGLPCHATGPFDGTYYDPYTDQYCFNPNTPSNQNNVWMIPTTPTPTSTPAIDVLNTLGPIGVTITGASFYNPYDGGGVPAPGNICMDYCQGHASPDGSYHYHQMSPCFNQNDDPDGHSGLVGYAFDGYAIYGLNDTGGSPPTDLDECGGHTDSVRGYHYHFQSEFPFTLGCYRGEPELSNFAGGGGGGGGGGGRGGGGGGGGCSGCAALMIPPSVCNCVHTTPGYEGCCFDWTPDCQAYADQFCN